MRKTLHFTNTVPSDQGIKQFGSRSGLIWVQVAFDDTSRRTKHTLNYPMSENVYNDLLIIAVTGQRRLCGSVDLSDPALSSIQ